MEKERLLLITGQLGIGKTTLADVLLLTKARDSYQIFKVVDVEEAEKMISPDDELKQIFYFDDFLGEVYYEIISGSKNESQITSFVNRIRDTPNKYLVLTTRTIILNQALNVSEKLTRSGLPYHKFELKLSDYSKLDKAKILYNHLYFNEVREDLYQVVLQDKFYSKIIIHPNYTPRIIDFITGKFQINNLSPEQYHDFIISNLNNPKEIWSMSFQNQIKYFDRILLLICFRFKGVLKKKIYFPHLKTI